jgi:septal ring factor EnvC (AmiA/AmiB activator)
MEAQNHQSKEEQLSEELKSLRREMAALITEKAAFGAQSKLLEHLVAMARSSGEEEMLKATLQETLDLSSKLTGALLTFSPSNPFF